MGTGRRPEGSGYSSKQQTTGSYEETVITDLTAEPQDPSINKQKLYLEGPKQYSEWGKFTPYA